MLHNGLLISTPRKDKMPMYRVKFRADKEDQLIEAKMMGNSGTSYVFFDNKDIVAQVPKDAVLSVVKEKADAKVTDHSSREFKPTHYRDRETMC